MRAELKDYIEQLLENIADEVNVKEIRLEHAYATSVYRFDTIHGKNIGLDDEWPLYSLILTGNIREDMAKIREITTEGLRQRSVAKIKVRQPLQSITIKI